MRKVILELAVSLDGFIEGPNGEYDWCFTDQDYGLTEFINSIDAIFMGRRSFEAALKEPGPWKDMTTYVFTKSMEKSPAHNVILIRDINEVKEIIQKPGKNIWLFGGAELVTQFVNANLIDEVRMSVHPILLGKGKPLFTGIEGRKKLHLIESRPYSSGLVSLKYKFMYTAKQSITIAAPRSKVWEAITKPELVKKYFFDTEVKSTWKKGDPIKFTGQWEGKPYEDKGIILEIEKEKLLKYSYFSAWSGKPDVPENYNNVTYKLNDMGGNTEYIVEQEGLETEDAARKSEQNWAHVLEAMRQLLEKNQ